MFRIPCQLVLLAIYVGVQVHAADTKAVEGSEQPDQFFGMTKVWEVHIQFSADQWQAIQQTVSKFIEVLKEHIDDYPAGEYGKARVFLNSLANEANFPAS